MAVSFSSYFSFLMSPGNGGGLAFAVFPSGFPLDVLNGSSSGLSHGLKERGNRVFAVEFDTSRDAQHGDSNGYHVGFNVADLVSVSVSNVSSINLALNSGDRLNCWIDYEAASFSLLSFLQILLLWGFFTSLVWFLRKYGERKYIWGSDEICNFIF